MQHRSKDGSVHVTDEAINTATHMAGALFAFFGSSILVISSIQQRLWWHVLAFTVYGFSLIGLFTMSALHHGVKGSEKTNRVLRTLDYVAVYGLIIGTITPLCLVVFRNPIGFAALATLVLAASFGITMRSVYHTLPHYISLTLYLCMGWLPVLLILLNPRIITANGIILLVLGGLFYSIGAFVYAREKPNPKPGFFGFHEIWHIAVLLGALSHFMFMYHYVLPMR